MAIPAIAGAQERALPTCQGEVATIVGTPGDDVIVGTPGDDVIVGRGGDDVIDGKGGADVICGGTGNDVISGNSGDDRIRGGGGADLISGGVGDDTIAGGGGNDTLKGHSGSDVLKGQSGRDTATGGSGVDACKTESVANCELIPLAEGDRGTAVKFLQQTLFDRKLYRGEIDGVFDKEVAISVATFHKVTGRGFTNPAKAVAKWKANPPSEAMSRADWDRLLSFVPTAPKVRESQPDRVEVDIGHQVLYLILDGEVDAIVHVSTGLNPSDTPRTTHLKRGGYFWYQHPYNGWSPKPGAWSIYKFWAYKAGAEYNYGIHGYREVPYWPASHGCTRVEVWEADYLHPLIFVGMPMHVWDE